MRNHTSFRIGGTVAGMFFPKDAGELEALYRAARGFGVAPLVLGNGTNLLAADAPLDVFAIKTTAISGVTFAGDVVTAAGGVTLARLAVAAAENGLAGLEFAHGIPGTLGGAVVMNAGAYGGEVGMLIAAVRGVAPGGAAFEMGGVEAGFAYRHSRFTDNGYVISGATLLLRCGERDAIRSRMGELSAKRRASQPLDLPSAGSAFKRPRDGYAAAMIDEAGLRGFAIGGAQVSEKHAGFIVNRGGATFDDVVRLMGHVQETVFQRFGVELKPEIKIVK
jgi:UDP-N-acetylmuramate dehydrogenase